MCGRFSQARELKEILKRFQAELAEEIEVKPRYNIPPSKPALVVYVDDDGKRKLRFMTWDLRKSWSKDAKGKPLSVLRSETVLQKDFFNKLLQKNRCLVPVDGFNEWNNKLPYRFVLANGDQIGLGGVFNRKMLPDGKTEFYFSLITTEPNALVARVHDRQPILIPPVKETIWLNRSARQYNYVDCLAPSPAAEMEYYPVSPLLNSAKNDSAELIEPLIQNT
jgi:putative SOS response-associated peptidase YedK